MDLHSLLPYATLWSNLFLGAGEIIRDLDLSCDALGRDAEAPSLSNTVPVFSLMPNQFYFLILQYSAVLVVLSIMQYITTLVILMRWPPMHPFRRPRVPLGGGDPLGNVFGVLHVILQHQEQ